MKCELNRIAVNYEEYGKGKPCIIIHGFSPDMRLMKGCMEPLLNGREDVRRIYLDLPGMGGTKGEDWISGSDDVLEIIMEFIDKIIPGENFLIAGESYGGYLARGIVYKMPERVDGVFLLCPSIISQSERRRLLERCVIDREEGIFDVIPKEDAAGFEEINVIQNRKVWERYRDEILSGIKICDETFLERLKGENYSFTFDPDHIDFKVTKPSLILLGRQDSSVGYKDAWDILENYPRATYAVIDGAGHNLQIEQVEIFNCLVRSWVDAALKASSLKE